MVDDSNQNQLDMNAENDADFGMPEVTLVPIDRGGTSRAGGASQRKKSQQERKKSNVPLIIGIVIFLLVGVAALWQFWLKDVAFKDDSSANIPPLENTLGDTNNVIDDNGIDPNATPVDDSIISDDNNFDDETGVNSNTGEDNVGGFDGETGSMEMVTSRTRRTYVIIGSFFDEDLAKDYALKLGAKGVNTKLISPVGGKKFYRLSVADFATISEASANLDVLKAEYGDNLWIIKH